MNTEKQLNIYPNKDKIYGKELKLLEKANLREEDNELILRFHDYLFSTNSKDLRVAKLSAQLRKICLWMQELNIQNTLKTLVTADLIKLIAHINRTSNISLATKADYRRCLKQFYKWYQTEDERAYFKDDLIKRETKKFYLYVDKSINISYPIEDIDPSTIISDKDTEILVHKGARSPRDKAFVDMLQETGCRIGEFLNMKIGDIEFGQTHAKVTITHGKTGSRQIFILRSIPNLRRYIATHPERDNAKSYLWISNSPTTKGEPLMQTGATKLLKKAFKRSGLNKRSNLHWLRHSRATLLAPQLTESVLCKYMGWKTGSKQVRRYVHLCNSQIEDAFLNIHNINKNKSKTKDPIKCICGQINLDSEQYCHNCYRPLKVETAIQEDEIRSTETNKTIELLMEISKDPKLLAMFNEFRKGLS